MVGDASSNWADRPSSDAALSSDEEDFVSTQSNASAEPDSLAKCQITSSFRKLQLNEAELSQNSNQCTIKTQASTPKIRASIPITPIGKRKKRTLQLLELPLDILKDIVKEVCVTEVSSICRPLFSRHIS